MFHIRFVFVFIIYLKVKFQMLRSKLLLIITLKLKLNYRLYIPEIKLMYFNIYYLPKVNHCDHCMSFNA